VFYLLNKSSAIFSAVNGEKKSADSFDISRGFNMERKVSMVSLRWQVTGQSHNTRCCHLLLTQPVETLFSQLKSLENGIFIPDNIVEVNAAVNIELNKQIERQEKINSLEEIEFPAINAGKVFAVIGWFNFIGLLSSHIILSTTLLHSGYITGLNKTKKRGKEQRCYIIVVPGHKDDKILQFLQQVNSKSFLWKSLLRKFEKNKFPTYRHCIAENVDLHAFKCDSAALFRASDGHISSAVEYDRCSGFSSEIIYNNVLPAVKRFKPSIKQSMKFGMNLLSLLKDGDTTKSKVVFIYCPS
jgi:hypothetical protein